MAGAVGGHALDYLAAKVAEKYRQEQMEELIDTLLPPAVEAGMAKLADQTYIKQIQKPGVPLYWNVTFELSTLTDNLAGQGTANMLPNVKSVQLSWEEKNSTSDRTEFPMLGTQTKEITSITYSFPADEIPFDDLVQYAASQDMDMSALRKYAEAKIAAIENPPAATTLDPAQQQKDRDKWAGRLKSVDEYALGVKARKAERARLDKIAEDKRSEERLQQVIAADKAKAQQPLAVPFFNPPGNTPAAQAPVKIGPFDVYGEATPHERADLIAAHFERKKEVLIEHAATVQERYDAGTLSDEYRNSFRAERDRWIADVGNYEAAMRKVPEMRAGAERLKALQDWIANDGHNALLVGI